MNDRWPPRTDSAWREDQRRGFGQRLKAARLKMTRPDGSQLYRKAVDFIRALEPHMPPEKRRNYYFWEEGTRFPRDDSTLELLATLLDTTQEWLLYGQTEVVNAPGLNVPGATINHSFDSASQFSPLRYIPILAASQIRHMLSGHGDITTMVGEQLPVPPHVKAGANAFYYQIPPHDTSMVGGITHSFPPDTHLMIDPDRVVHPGEFLLAWPSGMPGPVMRRLQSSHAIMPGQAPRLPYKLVALNPLTEAVTVKRESDCQVIGRVISFTLTL